MVKDVLRQTGSAVDAAKHYIYFSRPYRWLRANKKAKLSEFVLSPWNMTKETKKKSKREEQIEEAAAKYGLSVSSFGDMTVQAPGSQNNVLGIPISI